MCGIAGVRKFGDTPISGEELIVLLCGIEHRGMHATGIALVDENWNIVVHKAPTPAWRFTKSDEFKNFLKKNLTENTQVAILHTRAATLGNPEVNLNNHPMWDGETAIVHNGMIGNHTELFQNPKYKRSCETDSDIIRAIVSEHGFGEKGVRELCKLRGSAAIACVSEKYPQKLLLARSGSPLICAISKETDKMYWASETWPILRAAKPFENVRGVWAQPVKSDHLYITNMPNDTAWVFNDHAQELHQMFNTCLSYNAPNYSSMHSSYHGKKKRWKEDQKRERNRQEVKTEVGRLARESAVTDVEAVPPGASMTCPNCHIGLVNKKGKPWKELICPDCKTPLGV